jgi:hypothetical protein
MNMSARLGDVWPRMRMIGLRVGALVLLFYGASFYSRDWRSLVPHAGQPVQGQVASRSKAVARPLPAHRVEAPANVEPATTGALPRIAEAVVRPPAAEKVSRPSASASASSRSQAQAEVSRSRMQHTPNKRTQVAAAPTMRTPSPAALSPSRPEAPVQSRPDEPVQFRLAERSN